MDDVKELCTDMAIMNGGRILSHITPKEATKSLQGQIWTKNIIRDELDAHEASFNVISSNFNDDKHSTFEYMIPINQMILSR